MTVADKGKPSQPISDRGVGSTVETFAAKMRKKLLEQEERDLEVQKKTSARHALMLQGISLSRKAMQETCKISLGTRFSLELDVTEFESWPRLELVLVDEENEGNRDTCLLVSAHDRQNSGTITFTTRKGESLGLVKLEDTAEMSRLPIVVKRSIRHFLDTVGTIVIESQRTPKKREEEVPLLQEEKVECPVERNLQDQVFFSHDAPVSKNVVEASEDELRILPLD